MAVVCSVGSTLIPMSIPHAEAGVSLQDCIQAWHSQDSVRFPGRINLRYVLHSKIHVALTLKRFRTQNGATLKITTPVKVPSVCELPLHKQGATHWIQFHVDAIVVRLGEMDTTDVFIGLRGTPMMGSKPENPLELKRCSLIREVTLSCYQNHAPGSWLEV